VNNISCNAEFCAHCLSMIISSDAAGRQEINQESNNSALGKYHRMHGVQHEM